MKTTVIMAALLAVLLVGCGKKEEPPTPVAQPVQQQAVNNCWTGTILLVENDYTVFETPTEADGHKRRLARSGKWGQIGDTFDYCE